ncbi:MAG: GNAT family N-acetyltransferase [Pseudomonadota bacterium]
MPMKTDRLLLRPPEAGDSAWIAGEIANPKVHQWLTNPPRPYRLEDAEAWITRVGKNPFVQLVYDEAGPVGVVGISEHLEMLNLGFWLAEAAWGKGYAHEATHALVAFYFDTETERLTSGWLDGNAGSERVLRKLGFTDIGTRMEYCEYHGREILAHRVALDGPQGLQAPPLRAKR